MRRKSLRLFVVGVLAIAGFAVALSAIGRSFAQAARHMRPGKTAFPLKVSSNGRYLVDRNGVPFLMVGDSPQAAIGNLSVSEATRYFADRKAHGFNTVWINLLCETYTFCSSTGRTYDGIAPFASGTNATNYDLSTPNPAYFARAAQIIAAAQSAGLTVVLDPIETGGWLRTLEQGTLSDGTTKATNYGTYVGNYFKRYPNIIWMSGNDYTGFTDPSADQLVHAVASAIKAADPTALQTMETTAPYSSLDDTTHDWTGILGLNASYCYTTTYSCVLHAFNESPKIPAFLVESNYEGESLGGTDGGLTPRNLRLQEWWTMTCGATGQLYGSYYTDRIANGWNASNLDSVDVTQLGYLTALLTGRPWWDLVPDQTHAFLTAGYGTYAGSGLFASNDYATAAVTADGTFGLIYMPTARTITVAMSKMAGSTTAKWYDPTNGTYATVSGSPFSNTGTRTFTPSSTNSSGDSDWVLVLTAKRRAPLASAASPDAHDRRDQPSPDA